MKILDAISDIETIVIERLRSNHEVKECCDGGRQYRTICQIL